MRQDVLDALSGRFPRRIPSKETLEHPGIIRHVTGLDVYADTPRAFDIAWAKLGIDIHAARPAGNAPRPEVPGGTWVRDGWRYADYGVYPTGMPLEYLPEFDKKDDDWIYRYDPARDDLDLARQITALRGLNGDFRRHYGAQAVHYHLYYTLLFTWPIVTFGTEPFLLAAAADPERFNRCLWEPWARISRKHCEALAAMDEEVAFVHDDVCTTGGPLFPPEFFERYIFSRYEWIWEPVILAGKKLVFVSDGNLDSLLERLLAFPISAIMFETPATSFDRVLDTWGRSGRGFIGGIATEILTHGTPDQVRAHTREVIRKGSRYPGFIISSCGQLPAGIPMDNILAYFATRNVMGIPAAV